MEDKKNPDRPTSKHEYQVGYRKPPSHTRFKPGQSGNPRGRSKGTKNLKTDLLEELGETILVREGDQSRRISKQRAMVKTLVSRTLKGDARAAGHLLGMINRMVDTGAGAIDVEEPLRDGDHEILADYRMRNEAGKLSGSTDSEVSR